MTSPTLRPSNRLAKTMVAAVLLALLAAGIGLAHRWATRYRPVEVPVTIVRAGTGEEVKGRAIQVELSMRQGSHDGPPYNQGKLSLSLEMEGESPYPGLRRMADGARVGTITRTVMTWDKVEGILPNPVYPRPPVYLEMTILKAAPSIVSSPEVKALPELTGLDRWRARLRLWASGFQRGHLAVMVVVFGLYLLLTSLSRRFLFTKVPELTPPPVRLWAVPTPSGAGWYHPNQVAEARAFFEEQKFAWVQNVDIKPHKTLRACLLVDDEGIGAVIYDHQREGVWVDLIVQYNTMGVFMVSSAAWAAKVEQPPFSEKHILPGKPPAKLWSVFQEKISVPESKWLELTPDNIVREIERGYADEMDWRNAKRASVGADEVVVAQPAAEPAPGTVGIQKALANAGLLRGLRERFREAMPPEKTLGYTIDELAIVHRRLTAEDLIDYLSDHVDRSDCEILGLPEVCGGKSPVQAFEALQDLLPAELRFKKVGSLDFPLPADFYQPPLGKIPIALFPHRAPDGKAR